MRYGFIFKPPFDLYFLDNDNKKLSNIILDSNNTIKIITSEYWKAASRSEEFIPSSCCFGPGFYFNDFKMLRNLDPSLRRAKAIQKLI